MWKKDTSIEVNASAEVIWKIFSDVPNWKKWITDLEKIELKGAFKSGTDFIMYPFGQEPVKSRLFDVKENESFTDESSHGDNVIRVTHSIQKTGPEKTRIVYSAEVNGPAAEEIGPAIASGFPVVLKALAQLAESEK